MVHYVFSPEWFYGIDSLFDVFSFIVTLIIAFYAYKLYRFCGKTNYKFFSFAFTLFAFGFLLKVIMNVVIYYRLIEGFQSGSMAVLSAAIRHSDIIYMAGFFMFRLLTLLGLLGIYMVSFKKTSKMDFILFSYFMLIVAAFSHMYFMLFHITAAMLLVFIVYFYYRHFRDKRTKITLLIAASFIFMLVSQVFFILVAFNLQNYVVGETVQLVGFLLLMIAYIKVMKR